MARQWGPRFPASLFFVVASVAVPPAAVGQQSERTRKFGEHWSAAEKAAADRDFKAAAAGYAEAAALIPHEPSVRYRLACCLARLGETDRALAALDAAISQAAPAAELCRSNCKFMMQSFNFGNGMQGNDGDAMWSGEFAAVLIERFVAQLTARLIDFVENDCGC